MARVTQSEEVNSGGAVSEETLREEMIERFEQAERRADRSVAEPCIVPRSNTEPGYERFDKAVDRLSAGITRLERKLDRILALVVEARGRNRP